MISTLAIAGYRSLRDVGLALGPLTIVTGPNGSGKSSLYRALKLLADVAQGGIVRSLAEEGGLASTLWAGPETIAHGVKTGRYTSEGTRRRDPIALKLGFAGEDYGYAVDLGLPIKTNSRFARDPEIKAEALWAGDMLRRSNVLAVRSGPSVRIRSETGEWRQVLERLAPSDSMMTHCSDPRHAPELLVVRERMRNWRFYDHFRSDREAAARRPQVGTRTPILASDGSDVAAAIETIREIGDGAAFDEAVADAFPGSTVKILATDGYFELEMQQHGLLRAVRAAELSDGTLRYLLLVAALLSPRPPPLMVLNEPEPSLHPDLLEPLARLVAQAAKRSQIVVVSHAPALVVALGAESGCIKVSLRKDHGETLAGDEDAPSWSWPSR